MSQQVNPLDLTVKNVVSGPVEIKVKNISGSALDKRLTIELGLPVTLVDPRIIDAANTAAANEDLPGVSSLAGVVTGPAGWAIWATADMTDASVGIMLQNFVSQSGTPLETPIKVETGAEFVIGVPLKPSAARHDTEFAYAYRNGTADPVSGKLRLPADIPGWTPDVTLRTDQANPSAISPPGTEVKISWSIKDAVSGILRGPLPGGNVAMTLSDSADSAFKLTEGNLTIRAVGPVTYLLQAEVKGPVNQPNVQVVRMLSLDVKSLDKFAYIKARPDRVLPYGTVEVDWAAWGVDEVVVDLGGATYAVPLTDMTLSGHYQGIGMVPIVVGPGGPKESEDTTFNLVVAQGDEFETAKATQFRIISWRKMEKSNFTGRPLGMAVAGRVLALLTTDGFFTATVGTNDLEPINYDRDPRLSFTHRTAAAGRPKAWLAIAAVDDKFAVLRQTDENVLQVAIYNGAGELQGLPIGLPGDQVLLNRAGTVFDLVVFGEAANRRIYVVIENLERHVYSLNVAGTIAIRREQLLETFFGYRLLTFDKALYALHRDSGNVFRCMLDAAGKLEPYKAKAPVFQVGDSLASMFKDGMFVPVGRVLVVMSPSAVPTLATIARWRLKNVLKYKTQKRLKDAGPIPQDLFYNPQHNRWGRCGRGLDVKPGMICCFRDGQSPRLWTIGPNGDTHTLTVGSEHLFSNDYVKKWDPAELPPFLHKKHEFTIVDYLNLGPLNDTCRKAGLAAFSSTIPVEITPPLPTQFQDGKHEKFQVRYNYYDRGTVTWRYMVPHAAGVKHDYVFELTLHGPELSRATTVFKRVAVDEQGAVSIVDVPGTREERSSYDPIELLPIPLLGGVKLRFRNLSPFWLFIRSPNVTDPIERDKFYEDDEIKGEIQIKYDTRIAIYANGLGELPVDVDFGLPMGVEFSSGKVSQKVCVRFNTDNAVPGFVAEPKYSNESRLCICTLRYQLERSLEAVYGGDGAPGLDHNYFYVPVLVPPRAETAQVLMINADDLSTIKSASLAGRSVFGAPNSIAVMADTVVAIMKNNEANVYDPWLQFEQRFNLNQYDVITNLKGNDRDTRFVMLGMKQQPGTPAKYSYSFSSARTTAPTVSDINLSMDGQPGYAAKPVEGAPAWVSESTIPLMDVNGDKGAMCVEGGLFLLDLKAKTVTAKKLEGVGRQEGVVIDRKDNVVFFAHSSPRNTELIVSRINPGVASEKMETTTLPFALTHMGREPTLPSGVDLKYNRPRAVSLVVTDTALVVSHATNVSILDKRTLKPSQTINVGLPCRLIQVLRGTLPMTPTPIGHVGPRKCTLIWAVGSLYTGDGIELRNYRYKLYKIAVV